MKFTIFIILTILTLCSVIEAKSKKSNSKFEGDFEFIDEVSFTFVYIFIEKRIS